MKKASGLISLILIANNLLTGQYIPFVEEGKFWIYLNYSTSNPDLPKPVSGHAITFSGDTVINSFSYKKVYKVNLKGGHNCAAWEMPCWDFDYPYQAESREIISFIREDTVNRKIYNLPDSGSGFCETAEYLLFDFSLHVGDTVNPCVYESIWANSTNLFPGGIVDSIKVIETHGKLRNTIFTFGFYTIIGLPFETTIAIAEGLGFTDYGIFYTPQSAFVDYCEGEIDQCHLILSDESIQPHEAIKIYPNPSDGIFRVSIDKENLKGIRAYSISGKMEAESGFTNEIDLSPLENGIYLLEITTKDGERILRKIKLMKGM